MNNLSKIFTSKLQVQHFQVISLRKMANESLGIVVAGGMTGVRGDLPVFVQDIQPMGPLGKDKRLQRGDLLVQVNGVSLTGLSHSQAITLLKDTAQHCKIVTLTGKCKSLLFLLAHFSSVYDNSRLKNCWLFIINT